MKRTFLSYKEAAQALGVPVGTVHSLVHQQRIPHLRLGKRLVRFDENEILKWIESKRVRAKDVGVTEGSHD